MTVKELISRLQSYEDTAEVILASDAEGNQLHRIEGPMKEGESLVIIWPEDDFIESTDEVNPPPVCNNCGWPADANFGDSQCTKPFHKK